MDFFYEVNWNGLPLGLKNLDYDQAEGDTLIVALRDIGAFATASIVKRALNDCREAKPTRWETQELRQAHQRLRSNRVDCGELIERFRESWFVENLAHLVDEYELNLEQPADGSTPIAFEPIHSTLDAESSNRCASILRDAGVRIRETVRHDLWRFEYQVEVHPGDIDLASEVIAREFGPG